MPNTNLTSKLRNVILKNCLANVKNIKRFLHFTISKIPVHHYKMQYNLIIRLLQGLANAIRKFVLRQIVHKYI